MQPGGKAKQIWSREPETKTVPPNGNIHFCCLNGIAAKLMVPKKYAGQTARLSYAMDEKSRWVIVKVGNLTKEFWLKRDGKVLFTLPVKSEAVEKA